MIVIDQHTTQRYTREMSVKEYRSHIVKHYY